MPSGLESHLTLYSMGIAAENLTIGSKTLHITPIEKLTFVDGELKSQPTSDTVTGTDAVGNTTQTTATTNNAITATWFPFHSNRHTPPDIRRGERVLVWRFADLDTFLWTELGLDQQYRKLETATYVWNATQNEGDNTTSASNSYYVEVSTHKGTITLQTSQANGEKTAHTVQFNPMAGTFTFADNLGQAVFIDSVNNIIKLVNKQESMIDINQQDITISCDDTLALNATNAINLQTKALTVNASDSIQVTTKTLTGNVSTEVNVACPLIKLGSLTINENNVSCGPINITGGLNVSEAIECAGVNSSADVNAPNIG
jgi:hypothetical protein